jgi:hypothetical protein
MFFSSVLSATLPHSLCVSQLPAVQMVADNKFLQPRPTFFPFYKVFLLKYLKNN